jgi:FkbM family methyltransferase
VIAVEPSPAVFARLEATLADNAITAERHRIGLSDADGECTLYLPPDEFHNHSPTMVPFGEAGGAVRVPVRRLDDCLDAWGVASVDLLKIDVEGHEPKVFTGGERSLASGRVRALLCEFNDYWLREAGTSPAELHARLTALGFVDQGATPRFAPGSIENRFLVHGAGPEPAGAGS